MTPALEMSISVASPLMTVCAAKIFLNKSEDEILRLVEDGSLAFVFDISVRSAAKRSLRILTRCVAEFLRREKPASFSLLDAIDSILPPVNPAFATIATIRSCELADRFCCTKNHTLNLITAGLLISTQAPVGLKQSPLVTRTSVVEFLENRRVK